MPPQLTQDRRDCKAAERRPAAGVEAVDRLQEADAGHLLEVLDRLIGVPVSDSEAAGERQVALERPVARLRAGSARRLANSRRSSICVVTSTPVRTARLATRLHAFGGCPVSIMTMRSTRTLFGIRIVDSAGPQGRRRAVDADDLAPDVVDPDRLPDLEVARA